MHNHKVFVYGTLTRRGGAMNHICPDAVYLYDTEIPGTIYDLGGIPGYSMRHGPCHVKGEVWSVSDEGLKYLDRYEGMPYLYDRAMIAVPNSDEHVWVYEYKRPLYEAPVINNGKWKDHYHVE